MRADAPVLRFVRLPGALLTTSVEVIDGLDRANAAGVTYDAAYRAARPTTTVFADRTVIAGAALRCR